MRFAHNIRAARPMCALLGAISSAVYAERFGITQFANCQLPLWGQEAPVAKGNGEGINDELYGKGPVAKSDQKN